MEEGVAGRGRLGSDENLRGVASLQTYSLFSDQALLTNTLRIYSLALPILLAVYHTSMSQPEKAEKCNGVLKQNTLKSRQVQP